MSEQPGMPPSDLDRPGMGCGGVLMILIGIVLLLPGLCTLGFLADPSGVGHDPGLLPLLIACFMVGVGGIALILRALRR